MSENGQILIVPYAEGRTQPAAACRPYLDMGGHIHPLLSLPAPAAPNTGCSKNARGRQGRTSGKDFPIKLEDPDESLIALNTKNGVRTLVSVLSGQRLAFCFFSPLERSRGMPLSLCLAAPGWLETFMICVDPWWCRMQGDRASQSIEQTGASPQWCRGPRQTAGCYM